MTFGPNIIDTILMGLWKGEDYFVVVNDLISVIIPVYNIKIDYLESCIDSILQQTYCQFEVVIVNDGSCTECATQLEKIKEKDSRIFVFHKKNEGVSAARNFGLDHSRGEYIVYADGDDVLTPYYFEDGIRKLKENTADIVIGKIINTTSRSIFDFVSSPKGKEKLLEKKDLLDFRRHVFSKKEKDWGKDENGALFNFEGCWAHIVRREVAEKELFIKGISVGEDTIWALQISNSEKAYRICLVYEVWYLYIQNEGSVLHSYKSNLSDVITQVNRLIYDEIKAESGLANKYYDWIFVKLRQIIVNYLSKDCYLTTVEKIKYYNAMMKQDVWKNIMCDKNLVPHKYKNKCRLFKNGLIILYFAMRMRWRKVND